MDSSTSRHRGSRASRQGSVPHFILLSSSQPLVAVACQISHAFLASPFASTIISMQVSPIVRRIQALPRAPAISTGQGAPAATAGLTFTS